VAAGNLILEAVNNPFQALSSSFLILTYDEHFQVPDLLPTEEAHLRTVGVTHRSALLAMLWCH
jgi:hypothetical protein